MKEVELVVEMRNASCRTELQGLQLLLSAVPASAALTFPPAHSQGWIFLQEILNFSTNIFFKLSFILKYFVKFPENMRNDPPS